MKHEAEECNEREAILHTIRESKTLSQDRKRELMFELWRLPRSKRNVEPEELQEWFTLHAHADRYHGAIGGHITKTECYTSIGTVTHYNCSSCGEEAYIMEEL